jgi:hypothetical protein
MSVSLHRTVAVIQAVRTIAVPADARRDDLCCGDSAAIGLAVPAGAQAGIMEDVADRTPGLVRHQAMIPRWSDLLHSSPDECCPDVRPIDPGYPKKEPNTSPRKATIAPLLC